MTFKVYVIGVGMTKFEKPGNHDYPELGQVAVKRALLDASIDYKEIEQACIGYVYGDSTSGQRALYNVGLTGIPIYNVNNNCSTGSTALFMAKQFVEGGIANCVLALGFEKMERGSLGIKFTDRANPLEKHTNVMIKMRGFDKAPPAPQMFGNAGREHMEKYGTTKEQFAKIAQKNHKHSKNNPYSQFREEYTLDQILKSPLVYEPLTKLQCCPTSDGAAAAILCNEEFVHKHKLEGQAIEIVGMAMRTDYPTSFEESCIKMVGYDMSKSAAQSAYKQAGILPNDVQVIELHDCFSSNELITYEALGLCKEGEGGKLIDSGNVTYGGKWVVNPSGGLISKGHPLGATGLAQCSELCWQLRGMCGTRQVPNAKVALQHNIGLGGAVVVTLYRVGFPESVKPYPTTKKNYAIDAVENEKSSEKLQIQAKL
jgi:sterol carrier protein 2